jgi:hypothetical protein
MANGNAIGAEKYHHTFKGSGSAPLISIVTHSTAELISTVYRHDRVRQSAIDRVSRITKEEETGDGHGAGQFFAA